MHLAFAYDLMRELEPSVFVELGVYKGESYFAFCQSVEENDLSTLCYGLDTWQGDVHTGAYDDVLGREVKAYNGRYAGFSELIQATFRDGAARFADESIELLHIDGSHRYIDVKRDFETWFPKLSKRGIVLFHDVMVREAPYGVWRLWEEIAGPSRSFVFPFGHGLGVWSACDPSEHRSEFVRRLFRSDQLKDILNYYSLAASALDLWRRTPSTRSADKNDTLTFLQVFAPQTQGYDEAHSKRVALEVGKWCTLRVDLPEGLNSADRGLRIDPADCMGVITIARISIQSRINPEALWEIESRKLSELSCVGTAICIPQESVCCLFSFGDDPQIILPILEGAEWKYPLRIEILIKLETTAQQIAEAFRMLDASHDLQKTEIKGLHSSLKQQDEQVEKVNREVEAEKQKHHAALLELADVRRQCEQSRAQNINLSNTLGLTQRHLRDSQIECDDLSNRSAITLTLIGNLVDKLEGTAPEPSHAQAQTTNIVGNLREDIAKFRRLDPLWKLKTGWRRLLGRQKQSNNPNRPKVVARAWRQRLDSLQKRLRSGQTSLPEKLRVLSELHDLQNQVQERLTAPVTFQSSHRAQPSASLFGASLIFDRTWYRNMNADVAASGMEPLEHFIRFGAEEGRDPHPLFDTVYYRGRASDIPASGLTAIDHYLFHGGRKMISPHRLFDAAFYAQNHPEAIAGENTPLGHYLKTGSTAGYWPNPDFDPAFYLRQNPDVADAKVEPLTHYALHGQAEGRQTLEHRVSFEKYKSKVDIPAQPLSPINPPARARARAIAFFLPQFHPIPENNSWWGEGFTEWNLVRNGQPNFASHYQPHIPAGLGYYDLREDNVLQKQAAMAKDFGLFGFCFYFYWFGGRVLLDLPVKTILETGKPDFPFCLCWANENWTRRWDGLEQDILIAQSHSPSDDINFLRHIEPALLHHNYIRVSGRPLLLVYRPSLFPEVRATTTRWREDFRERGHGELHLVMVRSFHDQTDPASYGFDAAVQFPPHFPVSAITSNVPERHSNFRGDVCDFRDVREKAARQLVENFGTTYPAVMPSWDNTARRKANAWICANSTPERYFEWLSFAVDHLEKNRDPQDRLVFINAWNEWSEGCHLEPDHKYGYAWLNATALALRGNSELDNSDVLRPPPPQVETVAIPALPKIVSLHISVLFFYREDLIEPFLNALFPQLELAHASPDLQCQLSLVFNYLPSEGARQVVKDAIAESSLPTRNIHLIENGFNQGFGAAHNAIFAKSDSDIFVMLNSDVRILEVGWLLRLSQHFRQSDDALVGLTENASRLREDGCGIPRDEGKDEFDFVDGSTLAIRSALARRFGLFSPVYDYFYFEDADLCLRFRQMGLRLGLLDVSSEHKRSSSSRVLPQFAVQSVLDQNRARFFGTWGSYLQNRRLTNRIAIIFRDLDRELQCASLPSVFSLLSQHGTAIIDIQGIHPQLEPFFAHNRIRLLPSWQQPLKDDYTHYYELHLVPSEEPLVFEIAHHLGVDPNFNAAKRHLQSVAENAERRSQSRSALIYVERKAPFFEGKHPSPISFGVAAQFLEAKGFEVSLLTDYGTFEILDDSNLARLDWKFTALSPGSELLKFVAQADLVVTSDNWISGLSQLLRKRLLVWHGALSGSSLWDDYAESFVDQSLDCLGCYQRYGWKARNKCLRGDLACVRPFLTDKLLQSLDTLQAATEPQPRTRRSDSARHYLRKPISSKHLSLEAWPSVGDASVLVLTPLNPRLEKSVIDRARELASRATKGLGRCRLVYDDSGEASPRGHSFPHRLAAITPLRQAMIDRYLRDEQWVFWVDADVVDYPASLIETLIERAEGGIAAPMVLMEGDQNETPGPFGFGPGRFYDIAGFIENGRWARFTPPYFDQLGPVFRLDSVGCCYLVNADLYRHGAKHMLDDASAAFIASGAEWPSDAISDNQRGPANSFSDHYSVCQFARQSRLPVQAFADLTAYHQRV